MNFGGAQVSHHRWEVAELLFTASNLSMLDSNTMKLAQPEPGTDEQANMSTLVPGRGDQLA